MFSKAATAEPAKEAAKPAAPEKAEPAKKYGFYQPQKRGGNRPFLLVCAANLPYFSLK